MTIDILCRVVDNLGDIGVVYRLARALSEASPSPNLRLIVDDLAAFHALAPEVNPGKPFQRVRDWEIIRWDSPWEGFVRDPPRLIIECFACGRPEWLENLIFAPGTGRKLIVDLEYLTAESWADEFHLIDGLTRSSSVKKRIFMPGFSEGTGGLIIDRRFARERERFLDQAGRAEGRKGLTAKFGLEPGSDTRFWISVFSYEHDYRRIVADIAAYGAGRPVLALAASGKSQACFLEAWTEAGKPFPAVALPFLDQETWDDVILASDFSIVRGEESLARAALSGSPFLWHAYIQENAWQLVKVRALLERMRPFFEPRDFTAVEGLFLGFNDRFVDGPGEGGKEDLLSALERVENLEKEFRTWSDGLFFRGDLGGRLLTFLREFV
jgi:uncharacterized repeat protein (TIGR03837 family)